MEECVFPENKWLQFFMPITRSRLVIIGLDLWEKWNCLPYRKQGREEKWGKPQSTRQVSQPKQARSISVGVKRGVKYTSLKPSLWR